MIPISDNKSIFITSVAAVVEITNFWASDIYRVMNNSQRSYFAHTVAVSNSALGLGGHARRPVGPRQSPGGRRKLSMVDDFQIFLRTKPFFSWTMSDIRSLF